MEIKKLIVETKHLGEYKRNAEEFGFNTIVITGAIQGQSGLRFGRIVQVRKKSGAYGSDTVLLREVDELMSYHNMGFFSVAKEFQEMYEEAMKDVYLDEPNREYNVQGQNNAIGFVVNGLDDTDGKLYSMAITTEKKGDTTNITIRTNQ